MNAVKNCSQPNLLDMLYSRYYTDEMASGFDPHVSSHWAAYSNEFDVRVQNGEIKSLVGIGFGDLASRGLVRSALSWLCYVTYLVRLPYRLSFLRLLPRALEVCREMGAAFTFDCFKQVYALSLVLRHLEHDTPRRFLMIGDGYGFLSALVKRVCPSARVLLVDIGKTLLFQAHTCQTDHPTSTHLDVHAGEDADFIYCAAEDLELLDYRIDVAINIASMQEMDPSAIRRYFRFLRSQLTARNLFYCCNREQKTLPGGEEVVYADYGWADEDIHYVDELCPWYRYFFARGRARYRLHIFGMPVPLVHRFGGSCRHRLTTLKLF